MLSFAGHNESMKVKRTSTDNKIIYFDVEHSSALVDACVVHSGGARVAIHLTYRSNPDVTYIYTMKGNFIELFMNAIGTESAGKFAHYVRENADMVLRISPHSPAESLTPRKEMVGS